MAELTAKEQRERTRLHRLWATRRATMKQMRRCMVLDRRAGDWWFNAVKASQLTTERGCDDARYER
jgi:hypothetical protein